MSNIIVKKNKETSAGLLKIEKEQTWKNNLKKEKEPESILNQNKELISKLEDLTRKIYSFL